MNEVDNNSLSLTSTILTCNLLFGNINLSISVVYWFRMWNYIYLNSWLEHHWFSVNRDILRVGKEENFENVLNFLENGKNPFSVLSLFWLLISLLVDHCSKPISTSFWISLKGYFQRINEGFK